MLIFKSSDLAIETAFIDVVARETRFDSYSADSGARLGKFDIEFPIPWLPRSKKVDERGRIIYTRDNIPPELKASSDQVNLTYHRKQFDDDSDDENDEDNIRAKASGKDGNLDSDMQKFLKSAKKLERRSQKISEGKDADDDSAAANDEDKSIFTATNTESSFATNFEVAWQCPEPNSGNIVIVMNCKLRKTNDWHLLTYTLRESQVRYLIDYKYIFSNMYNDHGILC